MHHAKLPLNKIQKDWVHVASPKVGVRVWFGVRVRVVVWVRVWVRVKVGVRVRVEFGLG